MDEQKKSFLNVSSFSKEKGAIAHFLFFDLLNVCISFLYPVINGVFTWRIVVCGLLVFACFAAIYFISRWIAYHTKAFPKLSSRENLHSRCFLFFTLLSFLIFVLVIILLTQF